MSEYTAVNDYRNYLMHYGVLGMKWGVRRYQNPDGTLTAAGMKRYGRKLSKEIIKDTNNGHSKSEKDSDKIARNKALMKKILIGSAIAVGAAATLYVARNVGRNYFDEVIKSGTILQNLSHDQNRIQSGEAFYAAFRKTDKAKYKGLYGRDKDLFGFDTGELKFNNQIKANDDIKIASRKTASKVFDNLMKTDSEFRNAVNNSSMNVAKEFFKSQHPGAKAYDLFNSHDLIGNDTNSITLQRKFYNELSKMGYGGVHDTNDRLFSGFNTKADIIFDKSNLKLVSSTKLTERDAQRGKNFAYASIAFDTLSNPVVVAIGAGFVSGIAYEKLIANHEEIEDENEKK